MNDGEEKGLPHSELTSDILGCCFEVIKELGPGFLERVYTPYCDEAKRATS